MEIAHYLYEIVGGQKWGKNGGKIQGENFFFHDVYMSLKISVVSVFFFSSIWFKQIVVGEYYIKIEKGRTSV